MIAYLWTSTRTLSRPGRTRVKVYSGIVGLCEPLEIPPAELGYKEENEVSVIEIDTVPNWLKPISLKGLAHILDFLANELNMRMDAPDRESAYGFDDEIMLARDIAKRIKEELDE